MALFGGEGLVSSSEASHRSMGAFSFSRLVPVDGDVKVESECSDFRLRDSPTILRADEAALETRLLNRLPLWVLLLVALDGAD